MKKPTIAPTPAENNPPEPVVLKPLFGIHPGTYVAILLGLAFAVIFFSVLILPGIVSPGGVLQVTDTLTGSPVYIDDHYMGTTPLKVFVKSGNHTITVKRPFFAQESRNISIGFSLFGQLFFPPVQRISVTDTIEDIKGLIQYSLSEYAAWASVSSEFGFRYRPEPILSRLFRDLGYSGAVTEKMQDDLLMEALPYAYSEPLQREFISAAFAGRSGGKPIVPADLVSIAQTAVDAFEKHPFLKLWFLSGNYKDLFREDIIADFIDWYSKELVQHIPDTKSAGTKTRLGDLIFISIPGGVSIFGKVPSEDFAALTAGSVEFPVPLDIPEFSISSREVTNRDFYAFTRENPEWQAENISSLKPKSLVTDEYLSHWTKGIPDESILDQPVRFVSWFAANAYCAWFQTKNPGWRVRLPNEAEWNKAAQYVNPDSDPSSVFYTSERKAPSNSASSGNSSGIHDMMGNVWEWCDNWYSPVLSLSSIGSDKGKFIFNAPTLGYEMAVRGGSWINQKGTISPDTRGAQPPNLCTAYLGFRPIIVKQGTQE